MEWKARPAAPVDAAAIAAIYNQGVADRIATFETRPCYAGVGEFSVYVRREYRGHGAGRTVLAALIEAAKAAGLHKLTSRVFPENTVSRSLLKGLGFEEIGIHRRHGQLDSRWRELRDCRAVARSGRWRVKRSIVVAALGTAQTLAWGSSYYLPAILADPIAQGLGLSRTAVFGLFSGALLLSAVLGPSVGRAIYAV
jgi:L-amino acid N-acyltransferase YncA